MSGTVYIAAVYIFNYPILLVVSAKRVEHEKYLHNVIQCKWNCNNDQLLLINVLTQVYIAFGNIQYFVVVVL